MLELNHLRKVSFFFERHGTCHLFSQFVFTRYILTWPMIVYLFRSSRPEVFCKKCVLRNFRKFTGKHLCQSLFFNKVVWCLLPEACNFIKKENLTQAFSSEFCKISKNTFFTENLQWLLLSITKTWMVRVKLMTESHKKYLHKK